jgi:hypothetical protein
MQASSWKPLLRLLLLISFAALGPVRGVSAQVVQLPVFHQFSVQTTVTVPDRGGMVLGGVNSAYERASRRGPFSPLNRSLARGASSSSMGLSATIIDHSEWDRAVLAGGGDKTDPAAAPQGQRLSRMVARTVEGGPPQSLATLRQRTPAERDEAEQLLARGLVQEQQGRSSAALASYEAARRKADDALLTKIQERINTVAAQKRRASGRGLPASGQASSRH